MVSLGLEGFQKKGCVGTAKTNDSKSSHESKLAAYALFWRWLSSLRSLCSAFLPSDLLTLEISGQLFLFVLLKTVLQAVLSCYSKTFSGWHISCRSLAQSLIFQINPIIYFRFPFNYPTMQHSRTPVPWEGKHTFFFFLNIAKEFRDLPASVKHRWWGSWVEPYSEMTISTTPGPNLAMPRLILNPGVCLPM